ncbi:hypothetical protein FEA48_11065 [Pseudomonas nitroreducens]|uniref:Uncharacterized protein n=1 Tax=Pseudomonas nitroreducens TaxID=46680 RepID=A0A5R9A9Y2_PSENT|nr:hypothetical protein [Pseudomonas nitroreducens]TLP74747.1 hypothetical protein FEA48_11065 [Pseudomonas nitroreducens]
MRTHGKALFLLAMMSTAAHAGVLLDKTDRFRETRAVVWNSIPDNDREFALSALAFYPKGAASPSSYTFTLTTYSDTGEYARCHHNAWLIDGQRSMELESSYENSPQASVVIERFTSKVSREVLERVAAAKLVEFKICGTEGAISAADIDGVRQVLDATK